MLSINNATASIYFAAIDIFRDIRRRQSESCEQGAYSTADTLDGTLDDG